MNATHPGLQRPVDEPAIGPLEPTGSGDRAPARAGRSRRSRLGMIHGAVRWKRWRLRHLGRDLRARTGSRSRRCRSRRPACRRGRRRDPTRPSGSSGPAKPLQAGHVGVGGVREAAHPADHDPRGERLGAVHLDAPEPGRLVPRGAGHGRRRSAGAGGRRSRSRSAPGSRGSRAGVANIRVHPGWGRTRRSRGATGCRRNTRGSGCRARCRRPSRPRSRITKSSPPAALAGGAPSRGPRSRSR